MVHLPTCCCVPEAPAYLKAGYSGIICRAFPFCSDHASRAEQPHNQARLGLFPFCVCVYIYVFIFFPFTRALLLSHVLRLGGGKVTRLWVCNFRNQVSVEYLPLNMHKELGLKAHCSFSRQEIVEAGTWKSEQGWEPLPGAGKEQKNPN